MHGVGIYRYTDGIVYEGEYFKDAKMGYGYYKWTDDRVYEGWWFKGKQHGLGIYTDPRKGKRFGLWEHGKRQTLYDREHVDRINAHAYDYGNDLQDSENARFLVDNATFERPEGIDVELKRIKQHFGLS